ncbi:MAG: flagellar hook protein FlgE [Chloroflexi bacterium]|nr:flagellar hook protein FlgE [Chloroflexota bacterium]
MIRSMFTAISSLSLQQKYLDVVSNNLANANTTGFKASRVLAQDQFAQMMSPGSAPSTTQGGTNPTQVGLGVSLGYISSNFTQGILQSTGRNMDLGVQGDGFFIYGQNANRRYSREGSMSLDMDGNLVNSATGLRTQGWLTDAAGVTDTNLPVGDIKIVTDKTLAKATESVVLGGNLSANATVGDTNTISMGVYDSLGALQTTAIRFTRGGTPAVPAVIADPTATPPVVGSPAVAAIPNNTWTWQIMDTSGATPVLGTGDGTITFDASGQIDVALSVPGTAVGIPGSAGSTDPINPLAIDFSKLTQLASANTATVTSQDGLPAGTVSDVYISPNNGVISLVYSNGMAEQVGQVALARFTNPAGLVKGEDTTFLAGLNSGDPQIGAASTGGRGAISSSFLEASNVDMAQEFTNMILAQRGFQASSRVITTSDEILQELVNLKR